MNTGRMQSEVRGNASDSVLRLLTQVYDPGCHPLPVMGYRAEVVETRAGCLCLIIKERTSLPLMTVAVAEGSDSAEQLWPDLVRYFDTLRWTLDIATVPAKHIVRPTSEPWYATLSMFAGPNDSLFLGDFCRHFAWGWIERQQRRTLWKSAADVHPVRAELNCNVLPKPAGILRWWGRTEL